MKFLNIFIFWSQILILVHCKEYPKPSIVIIGAGISGLVAAKTLLQNGFDNITILEAEERIGGRIHSVYFGDNYIDLGATVCHGQKGNFVYNYVKNLNLLGTYDNSFTIYHSSDGKLEDTFAEEIDKIIDDFYNRPNYTEKSYGEYIIEEYNNLIKNKYGSNLKKLKIAKDGLNYAETLILSEEGTFSWFEGTVGTDYITTEGNLELNWKGKGYKTFIDVILDKYPNNYNQTSQVERKVIFNKEVKKVTYDVNKVWEGVTIFCSDGTNFVADHVITTTSLGTLKANKDTFFEPKLPLNKENAINNIGFGATIKIGVHYVNKWWDSNFGGIGFIWSDEDLKKSCKEFPNGPQINNRSWITYTPAIQLGTKNPNVLIMWFGGPLVPQMENLSDEDLSNGLTFLFKKFLGKVYNITKPDKIIHSTWYKNPHYRGVYSFQKPESTKKHKDTSAEEDLASPLNNSYGRPFMHFAGEATSPHHYSTVHGAAESGVEVASLINRYYVQLNESQL